MYSLRKCYAQLIQGMHIEKLCKNKYALLSNNAGVREGVTLVWRMQCRTASGWSCDRPTP
jgi:hypothetical protein